jgi:hypothetical protein
VVLVAHVVRPRRRDARRRLATALGRALADAGEASARLTEHADELAAAARARHPVPPVALVRDPVELRAELTAVRGQRDARLDARRDRHREAWQRWVEHWR